MVVGVLTIKFRLHGVTSLKQKRSILRRIISRVKNKFEISTAEVGEMDAHSRAIIGCAAVSNDARLVNSMLDKVADFVEQLYLAEIVDTQIEIIHV